MTLKQRLLYPFAKKFFAGVTLEDAVARARFVNTLGMGATLDFLGEDVSDAKEADAAREGYARTIEAIAAGRLDASVAIKLTHIGLDVSRELAVENAERLARLAGERGVFVWVDMEGSAHTDDVIGIYRGLLSAGMPVGVALQASLRRTAADLGALVREGATIRLVKGAYSEPPELAYQGMPEIRASYEAMLEHLFAHAKSFAIGTHDRTLIGRALTLSAGKPGVCEFQMLMGMRDSVKRRLASSGRRVVEYIPYGTDWYSYGIRRLKEKRRNILYLAEGLMGR